MSSKRGARSIEPPPTLNEIGPRRSTRDYEADIAADFEGSDQEQAAIEAYYEGRLYRIYCKKTENSIKKLQENWIFFIGKIHKLDKEQARFRAIGEGALTPTTGQVRRFIVVIAVSGRSGLKEGLGWKASTAKSVLWRLRVIVSWAFYICAYIHQNLSSIVTNASPCSPKHPSRSTWRSTLPSRLANSTQRQGPSLS